MEVIRMQPEICSRQDLRRFCGIDREFWNKPEPSVMHQGAKFLLILKGKGHIRIDGREYAICPNMLISILPWDIVQVVSLESPIQCYRLSYQYLQIAEIIKNLFNVDNSEADFMNRMERQPVVSCSGDILKAVARIYDELEIELGLDSASDAPVAPMRTVMVITKLVEMTVLFSRQLYSQGSEKELQIHAPKADPRNEIFHYIATHLSEKITLRKLSFELNMSETEIRTYISSTVGLSLADLLNEMRVVTSINYLLYSDLTLEELSDILGFADSSHLSKVFAARMGDKITQYRKTYTMVNQLGKLRLGRKGIDMVVYIYRHYNEHLNAKWVADLFGVTVDEVNQTLLYQVEKNFTVFLNTVRIRKACEILVTTDESILDVAMEVGFSSIKTFNRQFLRLMGTTPRSFRNIHTKNGAETELNAK